MIRDRNSVYRSVVRGRVKVTWNAPNNIDFSTQTMMVEGLLS
jgi:putative salt-induced outer membrane protein YdiY